MESDRYSPRKRCSELNNSTSNFGEAGVELEDICVRIYALLPLNNISTVDFDQFVFNNHPIYCDIFNFERK